MGFKEATPGLLISLISIVLLAIVSFNTPILKSLYFLKATYSDYDITFGTLGYCETVSGGSANCTGPTVGYEFDFATTFGVTETVISIPNVVTKLTYVLILHVAALVCSVIALLLGALSHIRDFSLLCFPSLFAYLTSSLALLAFILDLIIFYIMRARINALSGATATIGVCVWLTLAAWVVTAIAGCCFTLGTCCVGRNRRGQNESGKYRGVDDREKNAFPMVDPQAQNLNGKTLGPAMLEREVSTPLMGQDQEDKYLQPEGGYIDSNGNMINGPVATDAINGVGYGYGRRTPRAVSESGAGGAGLHPFLATDPADHDPTNQYAGYGPSHPAAAAGRSGTPSTLAGSFVGVGAGRSMGTVPWAPGAGGGAVMGAPGYVPGGSGGYGGQGGGQGGYNSYDDQQPSQSHYQDPYGQDQQYNSYDNQAHAHGGGVGGYNDSQIYGQPSGPIQPTPRRLDQSSGMGNIVSPIEGNHGYGVGGGHDSYGGGQERLSDANAYGGYSQHQPQQQHHLAPAPVEDGTGDIGGARPPSYDSAQVYSTSNGRYRGY